MRSVLVALATSMIALLRARASLHLEVLALCQQPAFSGAVDIAHD